MTLTEFRLTQAGESLPVVNGRPLDLKRYMGRGERMFPDRDAQDYIRELRDCDRTF